MDESLQLLPAVETLDLSRNKFSKLGNLRKCMKLKHLDLGFNNLRTISSFTEVAKVIIKLKYGIMVIVCVISFRFQINILIWKFFCIRAWFLSSSNSLKMLL